jgi:uncharacterized protein YjbJ (UPF0337 family)
MNEDILKGKWKQIRGEAKQFWGKLTNDDLDQLDGASDKLAGKLQERYGYSKEEAKNELDKFMARMESKFNFDSDK